MAPRKSRRSFTTQFKLSVVQYAKVHGNRAAGREYNVDERCVRDWVKLEVKLTSIPRSKRAFRHGKVKWPKLEQDLCTWVKTQREAGRSVSTVKIRMKAQDLARIMNIANFKGGNGWCQNFMKQNRLSVRVRTTVGQAVPADWKEKMSSFRTFLSEKQSRIPAEQVFNMDEVPLTFDSQPTRTVDVTGVQTVPITTTGNEKTSFTVVLAVSSTGEKLKPMVIFKRKTPPKESGFPSDVFISQNEKGWMNSKEMEKWAENCWRKRRGAFFAPKSCLIMDSMKAHLKDEVKSLFHKVNTELANIPGGMTKLLQPLDVSVNRPFKEFIRNEWETWMQEGLHTFTESGRMRRASYKDVCQWVSACWKKVSKQTILNGLSKCYESPIPGTVDEFTNSEHGDSDFEFDEDEESTDNPQSQIVLDDGETDFSGGENYQVLFCSDSDNSDFEGF